MMPKSNKAWLRGWDDAMIGRQAQPYKKRLLMDAWREGYRRGRRSNDEDVAEMKQKAKREKAK